MLLSCHRSQVRSCVYRSQACISHLHGSGCEVKIRFSFLLQHHRLFHLKNPLRIYSRHPSGILPRILVMCAVTSISDISLIFCLRHGLTNILCTLTTSKMATTGWLSYFMVGASYTMYLVACATLPHVQLACETECTLIQMKCLVCPFVQCHF